MGLINLDLPELVLSSFIGFPSASSSSESVFSSSVLSGISIVCFRIRFNGDDRSGVVSGETGTFLFFVEVPLRPPSSLSIFSIESFLGVFHCGRTMRFEAEAVISLKVCLDAPIFLPLPSDDLGVKKRVKVLGVTVGRFLGLPEHGLLEIGRSGGESGSWLIFGLLLVVSMACENEGSWSTILRKIKHSMAQNLNVVML